MLTGVMENSEQADKKPAFIRNAEALGLGSSERISASFDVTADVPVSGEFVYGCYRFTIGGEPEKESKKLELAIETRLEQEPHGVARQLVALASLFLGRRLELGPNWVLGDCEPEPVNKGRSEPVAPNLSEGEIKLNELRNWFSMSERLKPELQDDFLWAAEWYRRAIAKIEEDPPGAYLNLVTAIEIVSKHSEIGPLSLAAERSDISRLVGEIASPELQAKVRKRVEGLLNEKGYKRRKFVKFIREHINDEFWSAGNPDEFGGIGRELLDNFSASIYDQRSLALHDGFPFQSQAGSPHTGASAMRKQEKELVRKYWRERGRIPPVAFFERVVNHALKAFLKKNQTGPDSDEGGSHGKE